MKTRGIVYNIEDPKYLGRIKVKLVNYDILDISPWCWPCTFLAGPDYGFYCMPVVGDEVYVETTDDGDWVWTGFCWSDRNKKPSVGDANNVRVLKTPIGHQIKLDEDGSIEILHTNGNRITLKKDGDLEVIVNNDANIEVNGTAKINAEQIELNGNDGDIVTTKHICAYTGSPHVLGSSTVKAGD